VVPTGRNMTVTQARPAGPMTMEIRAWEFGNRESAGQGPTRTFSRFQTGTATLNMGAITLPAGFPADRFAEGNLAPGEGESFVIQMDTSVATRHAYRVRELFPAMTQRSPFTFRIPVRLSPPAPGDSRDHDQCAAAGQCAR